MKKITLLCALTLMVSAGLHAQYNYLENAEGQHGDIILGDVDNDGDLDIFILGEMRTPPHSQQGGLYINDGIGGFTKAECPAMPGWTGSADFGDIDGDGDIDLIFSGHKNGGVPEANARGIALNDGKGVFTIADPSLYPGNAKRSPTVRFADFNNDGLLDYMLAAPDDQRHWDWELNMDVTYWGFWSLYFQQPDGTFVEDDTQFANYFRDQVVSVGDFDNDGDVDIFLQGYYPHKDTSIEPFGLTGADWIAAMFVNDGTGKFTRKVDTELPSIGLGSHSWGDLDGNGFLDLIIIGDGFYNGNMNWDAGAWYHRIFSNESMKFSQVFESPRARPFSWQGANLLQDFDNDGDVDVLLGGWCDDIGRQKTYVFANSNTGGALSQENFTEITALGDAYLPGMSEQDFASGDLDGDNILDFVWMGFKGGAQGFPPFDKIDVNIGGWCPGVNLDNMIQPFTKLNAPSGLTATQTKVGDKVQVKFEWQAPANIGSKKSVTYNLAVKNTSTGKWLYNPMSIIGGDKDGFRQVNKMGNTYLNKSWTLTLPNGTYEWTVQAIDPSYFGGSFAVMQRIDIGTGLEETAAFMPSIIGENGKLNIVNNSGEQLTAKVYSISGIKVMDQQFVNSLSTSFETGAYIVEVSGNRGTYKSKVIIR